MTKRQKLTLSIVTALSIVFGIVPTASAMHIYGGLFTSDAFPCMGSYLRSLCSMGFHFH